jgi:urocanate hydratase
MHLEKTIHLGHIFDTLPEYPDFELGIRRAPKREMTLNKKEQALALKNALRYVPKAWHDVLAKEFYEELLTTGRIYGYRFRPIGKLSGKPYSFVSL